MNQHYLYIVFLCSTLFSATTDTLLEQQKHLGNVGLPLDQKSFHYKAHNRTVKKNGQRLLQEARKNSVGISQQDYKFLKGTSAQAAAGADYAHEKGIFGKNITILLLEDSGITHADVRTYIEPGSSTEPISGFPFHTDHGSAMAAYINAVAPAAIIRCLPVATEFSDLRDVKIINASFSDNAPEGFSRKFSNVAKAEALIVKSAGNSQENLSTNPHTQHCDALIPHTIFAGNLRQDYKGKTSSGVPGENPIFQDSFLWIIADDTLTASGPEGSKEYSPKSGTSGAAAILSGAAALILSKYPELSTADLREILLESADRDIFQLFGSGHNAVHVSDSGSAASSSIPHAPYDPAFWGKGVLSIKNALIYASLKREWPQVKPTDLRMLMLDYLNEERQEAAKKIQATFKSNKSSREALDQSQLDARPSLVINADLPDREFTKAPGIPSSEPIAEQNDDERLTAQGIVFPESTRKLKVISSASNSSKDLPWAINPIPVGAPPTLGTFLTADQEHVAEYFKAFFDTELAPLLRMTPVETVNVLLTKCRSLLNPFTANRVVYLGRDWNKGSDILGIWRKTVTIIDLFHDGLRKHKANYSLESIGTSPSNIADIAHELFHQLKSTGLLNDSTKSSILYLLKEFRTYPFGLDYDPKLYSFVIDNNLLSTKFTSFERDYSDNSIKTDQLIGVNLLDSYGMTEFLKIATSTQKEELKTFFNTAQGISFCADVAVRVLSHVLDRNMQQYISPVSVTPYPAGSYEAQMQQELSVILNNIASNAPDFSAFLLEYAPRRNPSFLTMVQKAAEQTIFANVPEQKSMMAQQLIAACQTFLRG